MMYVYTYVYMYLHMCHGQNMVNMACGHPSLSGIPPTERTRKKTRGVTDLEPFPV